MKRDVFFYVCEFVVYLCLVFALVWGIVTEDSESGFRKILSFSAEDKLNEEMEFVKECVDNVSESGGGFEEVRDRCLNVSEYVDENKNIAVIEREWNMKD